jgi:hypothetical protein
LQQAIPNGCPAKVLPPSERAFLGLQAVSGQQSISDLADAYGVSRKFVARQAATAQEALDDAFRPVSADNQVLFYLPVTKAWLRQATLGLTLICHSSYRGVVEFFRDLFDVRCSIGTVHTIIRAAVAAARGHNLRQDLGNVDIAGFDEIFQKRRPVLVGADMSSTYCFLLSEEEHRDADTWGTRLLELQDRGLEPRATIADFGTGLRAGQQLAWPGLLCRGDVFHAEHDLQPVVTYLENRAYAAMEAHDKLQRKKAKTKKQGRRTQALGRKTALAEQTQTKAIALADAVTLLARWLRDDIFAVSGLPIADRRVLFDFVVAELKAREPLCPHRIGPIGTLLANHREQLLAFAVQLDQDLADLAAEFRVPAFLVRELLDLQALDRRRPAYWHQEAALRHKLRHRFHALQEAVRALASRVVRASSLIENLNSRLRGYFFLRRQLGRDYLPLLQFFLNHRRFMRSERPERAGKSPAELLTGASHPHWLEMLGYTRFYRH